MIVTDSDIKPEKLTVGCNICWNGKILFAKRSPDSKQGGKWGVIAGKIEDGENERQAVKREIQEEVGLFLKEEDFRFVKNWKLMLVKPRKEYEYNVFSYSLYEIDLEDEPVINLREEELVEYGWFSPKEAMDLPLVEDVKEILEEIFNL